MQGLWDNPQYMSVTLEYTTHEPIAFISLHRVAFILQDKKASFKFTSSSSFERLIPPLLELGIYLGFLIPSI